MSVDGALVGECDRPCATQHAGNPKLIAALKAAGCSHVLLVGKVAIGVPVNVAPQIKAAQDAAALPPTLEQQRRSLVYAVAGAGDEWSAARERAFNADGTGTAWTRVNTLHAKIKDAEATLAAFDAAHPEILAAIKAEEAEAAERFLRAD